MGDHAGILGAVVLLHTTVLLPGNTPGQPQVSPLGYKGVSNTVVTIYTKVLKGVSNTWVTTYTNVFEPLSNTLVTPIEKRSNHSVTLW